MHASRWIIVAPLLVVLAAAAVRAENESHRRRLPRWQRRPRRPQRQRTVPPPSVTVIAPREAHGVLGRDVRSPTDEDMGRIVDVIVDRTGTVRAAVIDFGGFLGVGSRKIVVDWSALHFGRVADKKDNITLELNKEQVAARPNTRMTTLIVVLGAAGSLEPFEQHWEEVVLAARPFRWRDRNDDDGQPTPVGAGGNAPLQPAPRAGRLLPGEPARARLVHLLSCGRADRVRAVHRRLSDHGEMDPGQMGLVLSIGGIVGLIGQMPGGAIIDAASERLVAGLWRSRSSAPRARLALFADFSGGRCCGDPACHRELRAGPGDRRDQPRPGRAPTRSASGWDEMPATHRWAMAAPRP